MRRLSLLPLIFLLGAAAACKVQPPRDPCDPNPCTGENRNVCVGDSGEARCLCNEGFLSRPSGACEAVGAANCPEHAGDTAEPDDCMARAATLPIGTTRSQTIEPTGDYDFFRFEGTDKHVYAVEVRPSGVLLPRIDVFDRNGGWLGADERTGTARLAFRAFGTNTYLIRVSHSPLDPSVGTGGYAATLQGLGPEDHGDYAAEASSVTPIGPGQTVNPIPGGFLYPTDQDWFGFDASTSKTYQIAFDTTKIVPAVALFSARDTSKPFWTGQGPTIRYTPLPQDLGGANTGRVYLVLYAPPGMGSYAFTLTST